jgi:hypothetical protein
MHGALWFHPKDGRSFSKNATFSEQKQEHYHALLNVFLSQLAELQ